MMINLYKFARRGAFFGCVGAAFLVCVAVGLVGAIEIPLRALRGMGMPAWPHFLAMCIYAIPFAAVVGMALELFFVGLRAPNQTLLRNLFSSKKHELALNTHVAWMEEQRRECVGVSDWDVGR